MPGLEEDYNGQDTFKVSTPSYEVFGALDRSVSHLLRLLGVSEAMRCSAVAISTCGKSRATSAVKTSLIQ